jgi:hypothetical protein
MTKPFTGKIALDIRDSFPDWDPFLARNATTNGMATIAEFAAGFPGISTRIPFESGFISEVLAEDGCHLADDMADKAVEFIRDAKVIDPDKPFFMSLAPQAGHAPHLVPLEWADRYQRVFDNGYEATRAGILARQIELGLLPEGTELSPINPHGEPTATGPDGQPWPTLDTGWAWALADHQTGRHRTRGPRDRDPQGPLVRQRRPLQRPAARRPLGARTGPGRTSPGRRWRARRPQPRRQGPAPAVHLCVGRDSSSAVIPEYQAPFPFTGGTIDKVVIDVTGEHYIDHEAQVRAWFSID